MWNKRENVFLKANYWTGSNVKLNFITLLCLCNAKKIHIYEQTLTKVIFKLTKNSSNRNLFKCFHCLTISRCLSNFHCLLPRNTRRQKLFFAVLNNEKIWKLIFLSFYFTSIESVSQGFSFLFFRNEIQHLNAVLM